MSCLSYITLDLQHFAKIEKQVKSNVQNCFSGVEPSVIIQMHKILQLLQYGGFHRDRQTVFIIKISCIIIIHIGN